MNDIIIELKDQQMSNRAIAKQLGVSEFKVRYHLKKLSSQVIAPIDNNKSIAEVSHNISHISHNNVSHISQEYITTKTFNKLKAQLRIINLELTGKDNSPLHPALKNILTELIELFNSKP
jgi:transcriptional antiterminator